MKIGFREIAPDTCVSFNEAEKLIKVYKYTRPFPGFEGEWQEIATFTDGLSWYASEFAKTTINQDTENMITWFWIDVHETCQQTTE